MLINSKSDIYGMIAIDSEAPIIRRPPFLCQHTYSLYPETLQSASAHKEPAAPPPESGKQISRFFQTAVHVKYHIDNIITLEYLLNHISYRIYHLFHLLVHRSHILPEMR